MCVPLLVTQVVSCDDGGAVFLWDALTGASISVQGSNTCNPGSCAPNCPVSSAGLPPGRRVGSFANAHDSARLTAATFDAQQRRLVTGGSDGCVHIWSELTVSCHIWSTCSAGSCCTNADAPPACRNLSCLQHLLADFNNGCRLRTLLRSDRYIAAVPGGAEVSAEITCLQFVADTARESNHVRRCTLLRCSACLTLTACGSVKWMTWVC